MPAIKEWWEIIRAVAPDIFKKYGDRLKKAGIREFVKKAKADEAEYVMENGEKVGVHWATLVLPDDDMVIGFGRRIKEEEPDVSKP